MLGIANLSIVAYLKSSMVFSKKLLMYVLTIFALFSGLGAMVSQMSSLPLSFMVFEAGAFVLGIVFLLTAYKTFSTWLERTAFAPGFWLTISFMFFGIAGFILTYSLLTKQTSNLTPYLSLGALLYLFPYLFLQSYHFWVAIPASVYRKWYYPLNTRVPVVELRNTIRVKVRIFKEPNATIGEGHEFEAPQERQLGEWTHYMMDLYNTRIDPQHPIVVQDMQTGKTLGWVFYTPSFWGLFKTYFDPDLTIAQNNISTNTPVVARCYID
ncbi:MAG: TssN family type VI secretion system protein [Spirosomataceae bacterium]